MTECLFRFVSFRFGICFAGMLVLVLIELPSNRHPHRHPGAGFRFLTRSLYFCFLLLLVETERVGERRRVLVVIIFS